MADRGLCDIQLSGGYPHLTRFGHGNKNLKIPDRHNLFSFVRSL